MQISTQGAPPLAPVPGKARESRKTDVCHCHILLGVSFLFPTVTVPMTIRWSLILYELLVSFPLTAQEVQFRSDDI